MNEHYIVTVDQAHLRIFEERTAPGQQSPGLKEVHSMDFPGGKHSYTDRDTDMAGRFPGSGRRSSGPGNPGLGHAGMSIDERLPMQREEQRRRVKEIASALDAFFRGKIAASWDFAAGPDLNRAVLEEIAPDLRSRIRRSIAKDLVKQRTDELRAHFAAV